ncbi:MAG: hypothetical protein HY959_11130 [Ignavibacteriae bacterium]|nr:hypothetical protein [Ignavibacteriota bacterium]
MALDKIKEMAKDAAGGLKDKITDLKDNIFSKEEDEIREEFKDTNTSKLQEIINYITDSTDIVNRAGFDISGLGLSIAIVPVLKVNFAFLKKISDEEREKIMEEVQEKKIMKILMACLFKASDFVDGIKVGNYKLGGVEVSLGLTPGISVSFKK